MSEVARESLDTIATLGGVPFYYIEEEKIFCVGNHKVRLIDEVTEEDLGIAAQNAAIEVLAKAGKEGLLADLGKAALAYNQWSELYSLPLFLGAYRDTEEVRRLEDETMTIIGGVYRQLRSREPNPINVWLESGKAFYGELDIAFITMFNAGRLSRESSQHGFYQYFFNNGGPGHRLAFMAGIGHVARAALALPVTES